MVSVISVRSNTLFLKRIMHRGGREIGIIDLVAKFGTGGHEISQREIKNDVTP